MSIDPLVFGAAVAAAAAACLAFPALRASRKSAVVELAGFRWTRADFCRGWLITGDTGSGKTRSGVLTSDRNVPYNTFAKAVIDTASSLGQAGGQPPEQIGGIKKTIANYLQAFVTPHIVQVFCPAANTFDFANIDRGKIICVAIGRFTQQLGSYPSPI